MIYKCMTGSQEKTQQEETLPLTQSGANTQARVNVHVHEMCSGGIVSTLHVILIYILC